MVFYFNLMKDFVVQFNPLNLITNTCDNKWCLINLHTGREYEIDGISIYTLICSINGIKYYELLLKVVEDSALPIEYIADTIKYLIFEKLLVDEQYLSETREHNNLLKSWELNNWEYASFYFLGTFNMKFLDAVEERNVANENMLTYHDEIKDIERCLVYDNYIELIPLDKISAEMVISSNQCFWDKIKLIATLSSGVISKMKPIWGGSELFMKCHPSGGARHPTELYILQNTTTKEIEKGLYHVQVEPNCIKLINNNPLDCDIIYSKILNYGLNRSDKPCNTIFIFSTVVYRNQYRYRESRTFRTIHMDLGHVMSTSEMLASELDLYSYSGYLYEDIIPNTKEPFEELALGYLAISNDE